MNIKRYKSHFVPLSHTNFSMFLDQRHQGCVGGVQSFVENVSLTLQLCQPHFVLTHHLAIHLQSVSVEGEHKEVRKEIRKGEYRWRLAINRSKYWTIFFFELNAALRLLLRNGRNNSTMFFFSIRHIIYKHFVYTLAVITYSEMRKYIQVHKQSSI